MYLAALIIPYCIAYFVIATLFSEFFESRRPVYHTTPVRSLLMIVLSALGILAAIHFIADPELYNRIEHAIGGGVLVTFICFWAVRDTRMKVNAFQYAVFTLLLVTALGVVNELFEFFLQTHTSLIASDNPLDTWRDLASNTAGILLALAVTTPMIGRGDGRHR